MQRTSASSSHKKHKLKREITPRTLVKAEFPAFFDHAGRHVVVHANELRGGLTNRSFFVRTKSNEYVARLPGRGSEQFINRLHESLNTQVAFEAGTTPAVVYDEKNGKKVTLFLKHAEVMNRKLRTEPHRVLEVVAVLKKLHAAGTPFANTVDVFARNREMAAILFNQDYPFTEEHLRITDRINEIEALFSQFTITKVPCHNDTTLGNFMLSNGKMQMIDFEYGGNNDPVWDLACLSMEADFTQSQSEFLLRAYYGAELDASIAKRFFLYQPVVEYWVSLWCKVQQSNATYTDTYDELKKMETLRFGNCQQLLEGMDLTQETEIDEKRRPSCQIL